MSKIAHMAANMIIELRGHTGQNSKESGAEVSFIEQRRLTACSIVTQYPFFLLFSRMRCNAWTEIADAAFFS